MDNGGIYIVYKTTFIFLPIFPSMRFTSGRVLSGRRYKEPIVVVVMYAR